MMTVLLDMDERGWCWCRVAGIYDNVRNLVVHTVCKHGWMIKPVFDGRGGWPVDAILGIRQQGGGESTRDLVSACLVLQDALQDLGAEQVEFGQRLRCLADSYLP